MASASVTVRMDEDLKRQSEQLFSSMGLTMTTAFTVFAAATVRQGKIPFEVVGDPFFSPANQARLMRAKEQIEAGRGVLHELIEDDDA